MTLHKCFLTLLYSWGSDTPAEAIWAANDFLKFFRESSEYYSFKLKGLEFVEDDENGENEKVLQIIKSL